MRTRVVLRQDIINVFKQNIDYSDQSVYGPRCLYSTTSTRIQRKVIKEVAVLLGINSAHSTALKIPKLGCIHTKPVWRVMWKFSLGLQQDLQRPPRHYPFLSQVSGGFNNPHLLWYLMFRTFLVTLRCIRVDAVLNGLPRLPRLPRLPGHQDPTNPPASEKRTMCSNFGP